MRAIRVFPAPRDVHQSCTSRAPPVPLNACKSRTSGAPSRAPPAPLYSKVCPCLAPTASYWIHPHCPSCFNPSPNVRPVSIPPPRAPRRPPLSSPNSETPMNNPRSHVLRTLSAFLLASTIAGPISAQTAVAPGDGQHYTDKLFGKQFTFTPTADEVMVKFRSERAGVRVAEIAELLRSTGVTSLHDAVRLGVSRPLFPVFPEAHDANGSLIQSRFPANPHDLAQSTNSNLLFEPSVDPCHQTRTNSMDLAHTSPSGPGLSSPVLVAYARLTRSIERRRSLPGAAGARTLLGGSPWEDASP